MRRHEIFVVKKKFGACRSFRYDEVSQKYRHDSCVRLPD